MGKCTLLGEKTKAQLETYSNYTFVFYQEGVIQHNILQMLAIILLFPTGETAILRNESCSVKNDMVRCGACLGSDAIRIGIFYDNQCLNHLFRKLLRKSCRLALERSSSDCSVSLLPSYVTSIFQSINKKLQVHLGFIPPNAEHYGQLSFTSQLCSCSG